jgi:hypothetical protein
MQGEGYNFSRELILTFAREERVKHFASYEIFYREDFLQCSTTLPESSKTDKAETNRSSLTFPSYCFASLKNFLLLLCAKLSAVPGNISHNPLKE